MVGGGDEQMAVDDGTVAKVSGYSTAQVTSGCARVRSVSETSRASDSYAVERRRTSAGCLTVVCTVRLGGELWDRR